MKDSLRLVPYVDSREDGGSSSHKGFAVSEAWYMCWGTSRPKFYNDLAYLCAVH